MGLLYPSHTAPRKYKELYLSYMYVNVCGCYFQVKRINKVSAELAKKACKDVELETGSTAWNSISEI